MTPAATRSRRYRQRRRDGRISVTHDVSVSLVEDLIAVGALRADQYDNAIAIGHALEQVEVMIVRVTA